MPTRVHVSPNGLTTLVSPQHAFPLVSLQFWVQTGSVHEGAHLGAGLSHLVEHMVFKGTAELSGRELNERVPALGGQWNAYTSTDRTVYYIDGPAEHWREFLHLLTQLVFHPTFPAEEFACECETIRREMAMYEDDPQDCAYRALMTTLFKAHPRRLPVIGSRAAFDALGREDALAYHRERYVPGNVFVSIAGDVSPEEVLAAVEEEAGALPPAPLSALPPALREQRQWGPRVHRCEFAQPTTSLMLAWRTPNALHADAAALTLLSSILGDGRSAWLYERFHDELALAHDISVSLIPDREGEGAFVVEADVERSSRDALRDALLEYVATLPQLPEEVWRAALARALRQLRRQRLQTLSTVQGVANTQGLAWFLSRNLDCMEEWHAALNRVTPQELVEVATRYFEPSRLVEVSVDPLGSNPPEEEDAASSPLGAACLHELPNGLRVVTRVDRRVPMVHAALTLGAGCPSESAEKAGLNSLLAECLLKGTHTRSAAEVADALESLGGSISSGAGNNSLSLSARCLAEDCGTMLELLADVLLHPSFPAEAVETEKQAMISDILEAEEDPVALTFRHLRRLSYGDVSYGHVSGGTEASVRSLERADLVAQHARLCCARNMVLSIAGDIDPELVMARVAELFAPLPEGCPVAREATPAHRSGELHLPSDKAQAVLALSLPGLSVGDEALILQLIFEEWCRDMTGPIFTEIREKRGLAYYASASSLLGVDAGSFYFYLGTAPESLYEARAVLEAELDRLAREGMPPEALERARATALASRTFARQSCRKLCAAAAIDTLLGLGPDHDERMTERLRRVSVQEVNALITKLLDGVAPRAWVATRPEGAYLAAKPRLADITSSPEGAAG